MFAGHTDVVTEGDLGAWTVDPFGAELRDGRIWGRGAADMKSGLAAMLHAVRAVQLSRSVPGPAGRRGAGRRGGADARRQALRRTWRELLAGEIDGVIVCEPEDGEICAVGQGRAPAARSS